MEYRCIGTSMTQKGRLLSNAHSCSSAWRRSSLLSGAPAVLCSSAKPEPLVNWALRLWIPLSLVATESEPTLDERRGFSKMCGLQHGSQREMCMTWGQLWLLSASVGEDARPQLPHQLDLNERSCRISLRKYHPNNARVQKNIILEGHSGKILHWVWKNSAFCFPKRPTLIFCFFSQDWWNLERPVCPGV